MAGKGNGKKKKKVWFEFGTDWSKPPNNKGVRPGFKVGPIVSRKWAEEKYREHMRNLGLLDQVSGVLMGKTKPHRHS